MIWLLIFPSSCHTLSCKFSLQLIIWCNNVDQNDNFYHWLLINILIVCLLDNVWLWKGEVNYKTVNYFLVHSLSLLIEKPIGERMPQQATGFKFILYSNVLKVPLYWLSWFSFIQLITTFHPFTTSSMGKHYKLLDFQKSWCRLSYWVGGQWELGKFFLVASHRGSWQKLIRTRRQMWS